MVRNVNSTVTDAPATQPTATPCCRVNSRLPSAYAPTTTNVTTAANGRYIRRSAATSPTLGRKLEVGPKTRKNNAPKKPNHGRRQTAHTVAPNKPTTRNPATIPSFRDLVIGQSK